LFSDDYAIDVEQAELKIEKTKRKLFQRREGSGKDLTSAFYSYPDGCSPDNLQPYKVCYSLCC